jgi:hypothetical protein
MGRSGRGVFQVRQDFKKPHTLREPVGFNIRKASPIHWIDPAMKKFLAL